MITIIGGTVLLVWQVLRLTADGEPSAPGAAAKLEEEGVRDPDKVVGELAEHYRSAEESGRASRATRQEPGLSTWPTAPWPPIADEEALGGTCSGT